MEGTIDAIRGLPPMPSLYVMLGRRLCAARNALGIDAQSFATELGLPYSDYAGIEQGNVAADLDTIVEAAEITGKSLCFFLKGRCCSVATEEALEEEG